MSVSHVWHICSNRLLLLVKNDARAYRWVRTCVDLSFPSCSRSSEICFFADIKPCRSPFPWRWAGRPRGFRSGFLTKAAGCWVSDNSTERRPGSVKVISRLMHNMCQMMWISPSLLLLRFCSEKSLKPKQQKPISLPICVLLLNLSMYLFHESLPVYCEASLWFHICNRFLPFIQPASEDNKTTSFYSYCVYFSKSAAVQCYKPWSLSESWIFWSHRQSVVNQSCQVGYLLLHGTDFVTD